MSRAQISVVPALPDAMTGDPSMSAGGTRDRFLAFAFAAADMLVETTADGTIGFAAGAFRLRFGVDGEHFVGRRITSLIAPADRTAFAMVLAMVPLRRRIVPSVLRLADHEQNRASISAMLMPGPPLRLCFAIGPVPVAPAEPSGGATGLADAAEFAREAEALLRDGGNGRVGLVEIAGWQAVREALPQAEHRALREGIGKVLGEAGPSSCAAEVSDGRFGVLAAGAEVMTALFRRVEALLHAAGAGRLARVAAADIPLAAGSVEAQQAARALRYLLSRFRSGGAEGARAAGAQGGLAGVVAQAAVRARSMGEAITAHKFRLVYQPVVHLADRTVHHYEALLRPIATPGNPALTTQDFVTFAEAVGLSELLDSAVLEEALAALRASADVAIAVNMSGLSLQAPPFRARVLEAIAAAGVAGAAGRLLVELTETAEIEDVAAAAESIRRLRDAGAPVCIDDFGAGAAAFRYLRDFNVDFVKIDGSYVRQALDGGRERGFIASMVELAGSCNAQVIAEMVEIEEQAALMRELGVQYGQGWLFGYPGVLPGARR